MTGSTPVDERLWRDLESQTLARLVRAYGSDQFDLCEDAVQEALLDAHLQWPLQPPNVPRAWMTAVARRRYIDRVRSDARRRHREARVARLEAPLDHAPEESDDALLLLQRCCNPSLPKSGWVALTLRAVAGLTTRRIANVYQVPEATIAQRITRAKRRIAELERPFPRPGHADERQARVLDVLCVMFTEAHHTTSGEPASDPQLAEAVHLVWLLGQAVPGSTEIAGLLSLMLLTEARHPARVDARGRRIPLDEQDRSRWYRPWLDEGLALLGHISSRHELPACMRRQSTRPPRTGPKSMPSTRCSNTRSADAIPPSPSIASLPWP